VSIDIEPEAGGGCVVTLTHEIEPEFAESAEATAFGWSKMLEYMAAALAQTQGV